MTPTQKRIQLRQLFRQGRCTIPGTVFDPISARLSEQLGFESGMLSGSIASLVILGDPDLSLITLSELVEQVRRICRACEMPIIVDADHGYGNALNVRRTVIELEAAGAAALTIEDTVLPSGFGEASTRLVSIEEGVGKMRAAVEARQDENLMLVARTNATPAGFADGLARAMAYARTGVDMVFVSGVKTREDVVALSRAVDLPLIIGVVPDEIKDLDFLSENRVRILLPGRKPFLDSVKAMYSALNAVRGEGAPDLSVAQLMQAASKDDAFQSLMQDYLGLTQGFVNRA